MRLAIRIASILAGLLILAVLGVTVHDYWCAARILDSLSGYERAAACEQLCKPVTIPREWLRPPLVPSRVEAGFQQLSAIAAESLPTSSTKSPTMAETAAVWNDAPHSTVTECVRRVAIGLAEDPEYNLAAIDVVDSSPVALPAAHAVLTSDSQRAARRGDSGLAFSRALSAMRLARRTSGVSVIAHLLADSMIHLSSISLAHAATVSTSSAEIAEALTEMQRLDSTLNLEVLSNCKLLDKMSLIRYMRRNGSVDFQRVRTNSDLYAMLLFGTRVPPRLKLLPASREALLTFLAATVAVPDEEEAVARELYAKASFDLAELSLAQRLDELTSAAGTLASVADALCITLRDPYTGGPYQYDGKNDRFYSFGPNRRDDQMQRLFSPVNGVRSAGDLWLP